MLLIFAALGCTISSVPFVRAESVESADELLFNDTCDSHHVSLLQENLVHPATRTKRVSIDEHALADKVHVELLHSREEKTQQPPNSRSDLWPLWAPLVGLMLVNVVWLALLFLIGNIDDDAGVEPETPGRIALAESAPSLRDVPLDHLKWFLVGLVCLDYSFRVHGASNVEDWDFWQWLLEKGHWDHHMVQSLVFVNIFANALLFEWSLLTQLCQNGGYFHQWIRGQCSEEQVAKSTDSNNVGLHRGRVYEAQHNSSVRAFFLVWRS